VIENNLIGCHVGFKIKLTKVMGEVHESPYGGAQRLKPKIDEVVSNVVKRVAAAAARAFLAEDFHGKLPTTLHKRLALQAKNIRKSQRGKKVIDVVIVAQGEGYQSEERSIEGLGR
jgi:hypothetical protein